MKSMRERFTNTFLSTGTTWTGDTIVELPNDVNPQLILDFIEQELKKEREEIVEWIEKQDWECFEQTFITKDIINTIKNRV